MAHVTALGAFPHAFELTLNNDGLQRSFAVSETKTVIRNQSKVIRNASPKGRRMIIANPQRAS